MPVADLRSREKNVDALGRSNRRDPSRCTEAVEPHAGRIHNDPGACVERSVLNHVAKPGAKAATPSVVEELNDLRVIGHARPGFGGVLDHREDEPGVVRPRIVVHPGTRQRIRREPRFSLHGGVGGEPETARDRLVAGKEVVQEEPEPQEPRARSTAAIRGDHEWERVDEGRGSREEQVPFADRLPHQANPVAPQISEAAVDEA